MAEQSSFSTPGLLQLADEYLTKRQQRLSARNELDSLLAAVSGEGFRNQQEKDAFISLQQYIAQNARDQSEIQAAERLSALLGPATKRQDDTPHYSFPEERINVYQQSQVDPANIAAMQNPQSLLGFDDLVAMTSQTDQSPAMARESFDEANIVGAQSGQSMETPEQLAKMKAAQQLLGQSEAPVSDLISSVPVEEGQQQNFVMDEEVTTATRPEYTMRGIAASAEERYNQLQANIDEMVRLRNIARRGKPSAIAPGFRARTLDDNRAIDYFDKEIKRLTDLRDSEMAGQSLEVPMDGMSTEPDYSGQTIDPSLIEYDGMTPVDGYEGMTPAQRVTADMTNFGKVTVPSTNARERNATGSVRGKAGKEVAGESAPREQAPTQSKAQEIAEQSAQNMIERLIDKQSQGADLATLMPSIRMFNEQLRRAAERDPSMDDLEKRLKSTRTGRELFALDAEVRNLGRDRAAREAAAGMTGAIEAGAGSAQAHFRIENAKEKARGKTAKVVFGSMGAVELLGYERNYEDYLGSEPSVRIAYNNAIQDKLKEIDEKEKALFEMETAGRMAEIAEQQALLNLQKTILGIEKIRGEIRKQKNPRAKQIKANITTAASLAKQFLTDPFMTIARQADMRAGGKADLAAKEVLDLKTKMEVGKSYNESEMVRLMGDLEKLQNTLINAISNQKVIGTPVQHNVAGR